MNWNELSLFLGALILLTVTAWFFMGLWELIFLLTFLVILLLTMTDSS